MAKMVHAGQLRHLVEVQENNPTQDATGQKIANWSTIWSFWAAVEPKRGKQFVDGGQVKRTEGTFIITGRFQTGLTERNRLLVDGDRPMEIHWHDNDDEREIMSTIEAREIR